MPRARREAQGSQLRPGGQAIVVSDAVGGSLAQRFSTGSERCCARRSRSGSRIKCGASGAACGTSGVRCRAEVKCGDGIGGDCAVVVGAGASYARSAAVGQHPIPMPRARRGAQGSQLRSGGQAIVVSDAVGGSPLQRFSTGSERCRARKSRSGSRIKCGTSGVRCGAEAKCGGGIGGDCAAVVGADASYARSAGIGKHPIPMPRA